MPEEESNIVRRAAKGLSGFFMAGFLISPPMPKLNVMSRAFFLVFFCSAFHLFSQGTVDYELLTTRQGLSQGMVYDLLQGSDGFLWLATKDGLNRYDGYHFNIFSHDPFDPFSLGHGEVHKLFEDSRGYLWIMHGSGLDIFIPSTGHFFHVLTQVPNNIGVEQGYRADLMAEAPDGALYVVDAGRLWKIAPPGAILAEAEANGNAYPELSVEFFDLPPTTQGLRINNIFCDKNGLVWLGAENGLWRLDDVSRKLVPDGLDGMTTFVIGTDRSERMWVLGSGPDASVPCPNGYLGWYLYVRQPGERGIKQTNWLPQCDEQANARPIFRFDASGDLWYLRGAELGKVRPEALINDGVPDFHWVFTAPFVQTPAFYITVFDFDASGIIWIGTNGFGAIKYNPLKTKFRSEMHLRSQRSIYEDCDGRVFLQIEVEKLYTSTALDAYSPNPLSRFFVNSRQSGLVCGSDGTSWLNAHGQSLVQLDRAQSVMRQFPWQGWGLVRDARGRLYSLSEKGLCRFDPHTLRDTLFRFEAPQALTREIYGADALLAGQDGVIWMLPFEGLIGAVPEGEGFRFVHYKNDPSDKNSLYSNRIMSVAEDPLDPARYLWVGTKGGGLNRLDRQTGLFSSFRTAQGLPDDVIYGVLPDNHGHLWLSTNKGLCRFHTRLGTVKNFTEADGLPHDEFNQGSFLKSRDGVMIFGGVSGLTVFHPDSLQFNEHLPQTHIVAVSVNNIPLPAGGPVELSHDRNFLSFEFSALEFSNPGKNRYRYQLVRYNIFGRPDDLSWLDLGAQHSVQLANLSPGKYTFRVLGSNNDGFWSAAPAEFHFVILPPWWASWWAVLLYAAFLAGAVVFVYRYQLGRRLEHQETRRLRELDEFKNRFFTNVTHEFRTPLTVILGVAEQWRARRDPWPAGEANRQMDLVRRNGENLLRLVNQLLDLAKLESDHLTIHYVQGDVLPYLRYIAESLSAWALTRQVALSVDSPDSDIVMDYDPERMLQIVYNLLSNAIKFTPSGGQVVLSAQLQGEGRFLQLEVRDTGVGIPAQDIPFIFNRFYQNQNLEKARAGGTGIGLALTKELVGLLGGEIAVQSPVTPDGKGTLFTVRLPVTRHAAPAAGLIAGETGNPQESLSTSLTNSQPQERQRATVLIVEDNPDVSAYLKSCLQPDYRTDFAFDGREGLRKALDTIPDLIISDVMMPEMDGFELCETLKNDERCSHIPVVLLTARAGVENRILGLRRGADAYLAKPFHQEELKAVVHNLLELRKKLQARYGDPASWHARPSAPDPEEAFVRKAYGIVSERLSDSEFSVDVLCRELAMSQPQVHRKLTALTGKNATLFIRSVRLARAKELLLQRDKNVQEVAFAVGFEDPKYFSRVFSEHYGVPPSRI